MTERNALQRLAYVYGWRLRYLWLDTNAGRWLCLGLSGVLLVAAGVALGVEIMSPSPTLERAYVWWVQIIIMVVVALIGMALAPKPKKPEAGTPEVPTVEDGKGIRMVFGEVWVSDLTVIGHKPMGTKNIRGKKSGFSGRPIIGYWYRQLFHFLVSRGPVDAVLEFRGGDKTAWRGQVTSNTTLQIRSKDLWGGEKTGGEGGIEGPLALRFGRADQQPSAYLANNLGPQQSAHRGRLTAVFEGGLWGAFSPYPKTASIKVRRILEGWDGAGCWYPETAVVPFGDISLAPVYSDAGWAVRAAPYFVIGAAQEVDGIFSVNQGWWHGNIDSLRITAGVARTAVVNYSVASGPFGDASSDPYYSQVVLLLRMDGEDGSTEFIDDKGHAIEAVGDAQITTERSKFGHSSAKFDGSTAWLKAVMGEDNDLGDQWTMEAWVWLDSYQDVANQYCRALFGFGAISVPANDTVWAVRGRNWYFTQNETGDVGLPAVVQNAGPPAEVGRWAYVSVCYDGSAYWIHQDGVLLTRADAPSQHAMNPAHMLYQSIADSWMGDEPAEDIDEASFTAAADRLYAEGFGLCTQWVPGEESVQQFQQRICDVIGASLARSPITGRWYLDLIRDDYVLANLPILGDDDIIEYQEQPATLDEAVNQVIVEWFDPVAKEDRSTAPIQSLGGIQRAGGVVAEVASYREIPAEALALRVGARDLQTKGQPQSRFELKTTRVAWAWRPGQRFRLQCPRRGIADMVCRVGDIDRGTLRSGAISLTAIQDVFALPDVAYVQPEPGDGGQPSADPLAPAAARVEELPYALLASLMPPGELAALAPDDAYLFAVASPVGSELGYTLHVDAGSGYTEADDADWCATALTVADHGPADAVIGISHLRHDDEVATGAAVLWGAEICRLDAIDRVAGTVTLGRGCADTVPAVHAAGTRLWILTDAIALDPARYISPATVQAKLPTRTGSASLPLADAPQLAIATAQRQHRPYAPGRLRIDGDLPPAAVIGAFAVGWAHRDRLLQADQLIDSEAASIGPEPGTTYTLRVYIDDVLAEEQTGLIGTTASVPVLGGNGAGRLEVWAVRDGLDSWQAATALFAYRTSPRLPYADQAGTVYADQNGTTYEG